MTSILRVGGLLGIVVVAILVLIGWWLDVDRLKTGLPDLTSMKANTAVGLLAAAVGLLTICRAPLFATSCAALVGALGSLTLLEYGASIDIGIDEALFRDPQTTSAPFNGRMSPATAAAFVLIALALIILSKAAAWRAIAIAHVTAVPPLVVGMLAIAGYSFDGTTKLYNFGPYVSVALHTAVGLVVISLSILATKSAEGWARPFVGRPIAWTALRRLVVLAVVTPFMMGFLVHFGMRSGYYQAAFTPVLFAVGSTLTFLAIALTSARMIAAAEDTIYATRELVSVRDGQIAFSERRYSAVVEGLPQLVRTCLPDGSCDYLSPQWIRYTGVPEDEQLGFAWLANVVHPDDRQRTEEHWSNAVAGRHAYDLEYRIKGADGTYRLFKTRGLPVRDAQGAIAYWFGTCTDIQDIDDARTIVQQSKTTLEERVKVQAEELKSQEEQLRQSQKMEAVGQLTGGLAHDFNNLLAGISGSLELMQIRLEQGRTSEIQRYVDVAQGAARRAAALTHRLLAFSRRQTLDPKPTNINRLVADMADLIARTMGPSIKVEVAEAAGLGPARVDPSQLENALLNLCINARDAMPDGGLLTIQTRNEGFDEEAARERGLAPGEFISLSVTDTGTGMTPDVAAKAFDPFFTTKPIGLGTGLGLSMIYGFARQSGGQVRIDTMAGRGTTIRIYLPRHDGVAEDEHALRPAHMASPSPSGETILVVDDEPSVRVLVVEILKDAGYRVIEAVDSPAGLKVLQSEARIDLLVTDVGLPGGMNGRQMADAGRLARPGLKILFITGYAENAAVGDGQLDAGMHVMIKPFPISALAAKVKALIET